MKRMCIKIIIGAVVVTLCGFFSGRCASVIAAEEGHALIILKSDMLAVTPDPLTVKQGATVIWVNEGTEPVSIKIKTKVGIACKNPVNFYADIFGYYETGQILSGATASICFIHKGKYEYEVKRVIGEDKPVEKILPATIVVE